jgi:hypothetical protein
MSELFLSIFFFEFDAMFVGNLEIVSILFRLRRHLLWIVLVGIVGWYHFHILPTDLDLEYSYGRLRSNGRDAGKI